MLFQLRKFGLALAWSGAALAIALVLQALFLFRGPLALDRNTVPARVDSLAICDGGRHALVLIREPMVEPGDRIRYRTALFSTLAFPQPLTLPSAGFAPFCITGARSAAIGFVASTRGDLYALDLAVGCTPILLGRHQQPLPRLLECTDDGSLLLAACVTHVSCWDRATARCLWKRDDCELISGMFVPGTHRLFAVQPTNQIVELDAQSGTILREFPCHCWGTVHLEISPDGEHFAATTANGTCVVSRLPVNEVLWSRQFTKPPVTPRFSADGQFLVALDEQHRPHLALLSSTSGQLLGELTLARAEIAGLAVSPQGAVYAWDFSGTVWVWDLSTRALLFQFRPEQFS
jgi:hypothetical protein